MHKRKPDLNQGHKSPLAWTVQPKFWRTYRFLFARIIQLSFCPRRLHCLVRGCSALHVFSLIFQCSSIFNSDILMLLWIWMVAIVFFIASFPNTSSRVHPWVPSGLCSVSFSSFFSIRQRELTPCTAFLRHPLKFMDTYRFNGFPWN